MKRMFGALVVGTALVVTAALVALPGCSGESDSGTERTATPRVAAEVVEELESYVRDHHQTPEEYIVAKFEDHDIVFLGEYHRVKHDVELVQGLIPRLHESGVYNLGIEFANRSSQRDIDRLLSAEHYDEDLANRIFWDQWPWWGYQEYVDILRAAWRLNRELPEGSRRFRVVGLNSAADWSHVWTPADREDREIMKKVWHQGNGDEVMGNTILEQFVEKGEKALVYSGFNHAYTEYRQPVYDESSGGFVRFVEGRAGNRVYDRIGKRCITIFLHAPWPSSDGYSAPWVRAADGAIDALIDALPPELRSAGFDVAGTPFEGLTGESSLWRYGYENFTLSTYCDGYVIRKPLSGYEGVAVVDGWFNDENRQDAIAQIANPEPRVKNRGRTIEDLTEGLASDTNLKRHFEHLY